MFDSPSVTFTSSVSLVRPFRSQPMGEKLRLGTRIFFSYGEKRYANVFVFFWFVVWVFANVSLTENL